MGIEQQSLIAAELVQKFGKPVSSEDVTLQNAFGAKYQALRANWKFADGSEMVYDSAARNLQGGIVRCTSGAILNAEIGARQAARANERPL